MVSKQKHDSHFATPCFTELILMTMTIIFTRGKFGKEFRREVAVKRVLLDEASAIKREVKHLIALDKHSNIIT